MLDFDLTHCGKCGYDLTGHPAIGQCPECGQAFDLKSGKGLQKDPGANKKTIWIVRHLRTIMLLAAAVTIMICSGVLAMGAPGSPTRLLATGAFLVMVVLAGAAASYLSEIRPE